ncbi:UDP-4-amino-4,6-dideoxy-N-acetyl-beta-L-altrosamine transaminase [Gammaproteobacteria bacterium]|nr:UDP-4-amino-4,6-dideoxy-N-acetyl-beta-L-altrosamine transaminase [Gammaproteobacteria bacterium]
MVVIPYGRQNISEADIDAVVDVLRSDYLTQGSAVPEFEACITNYCNVKYAVAVNSATSALHIACLALGVGKGDIVWTSPITFVASANCALYCGGSIDFVEIEPATGNICVDSLASKLLVAEKAGKLPKVVIPVHLSGNSCDMKKIHALSKRYGFKVIEDASHGIGGKYDNENIGCCTYSDITVFSFHPVKIITTGEGGMATTNNPEYASQMNLLRSHGVTRDEKLMTGAVDGPWYYEQIKLGFNYRMNDIQAALGISQMNRLDDFVIARHKIVSKYRTLLQNLPVTLPSCSLDSYSSFHLYIIKLEGSSNAFHKNVFEFMRENGVGINLHYMPVYLQPYYSSLGFSKGYCPEAENYYVQAISMPIYPGLKFEEQRKVATILKEAIQYEPSS